MTDHEAKMAAQSGLRERIEAAGGHPAVGDVCEHYKGGRYFVVAVGIKEDTLEPMIGYYSFTYRTFSFRTLADFVEPVRLADGRTVPRFTPVG